MRTQTRTQTHTKAAARIIHHAAILAAPDPVDDDNWNSYAGAGVPLIWNEEVDNNEELDVVELSMAHDPVLDSASEWLSSRD